VHLFAEGRTEAETNQLADEVEQQIEAIVQGDGVTARTGEKASS
jgi:hypothetical protein